MMLELSIWLGEVGGRLRGERERLGMNLAQFGEIGGVNRNSQSEYELGKRPCSIAYLGALGEAGIDSAYVLHGRRMADGLSEHETRWLDCFRMLNEEEREALLRMAEVMAGQRRPVPTVHAPNLDYRAEDGRG